MYKIIGEKAHEGKEYALKEIECKGNFKKDINTCQEIAIMKALKGSDRTVQILQCDMDLSSNTISILEEYVFPFERYLSSIELSLSEIIQRMIELCEALMECKSMGVAQLDVQPKNLFIASDGRLKLED